MKAMWNGRVIAESDDTIVVEGNHYFPKEAIDSRYLAASDKHTVCPWKGQANYYDVVVDGVRNAAAAWYYPDAKEAARHIEGRVAFWQGVEIVD